ncbi:MAG: C-terminal target protein [Flavipsychrobacter sp.]|nr:C-terminal target protein [Flavipsychrobacter sp.]
MKYLLYFLFFLLSASLAHAQAPVIEWQKSLGGSNYDSPLSIQPTSDGGYILAGSSSSTDGDITGNHGLVDGWVVKLSSSGSLEWQISLGGNMFDEANCVQQTTDGGYIVTGYSTSTDGDVTVNRGYADVWIVKLSSSGTIQWQRSYGGSAVDLARFIVQTSDGGYIVAASSASNDGDVSGNHSSIDERDIWVFKINGTGDIQWQKCYGGSFAEEPWCIQQTLEGGYIVIGYTYSLDGDVSGFHGTYDRWVVKLSGVGDIQWQKCYGGTNIETGLYIQQTTDSGYITTGVTYSNDIDVSGNRGGMDYWIEKLSSSGNIIWQKCYGGKNDDGSACIQQTSDGGYITAGMTESDNGDVSGSNGFEDYWVVKLSAAGTIQWQKCLGGTNADEAMSVKQTHDGGYVVVGFSKSIDGNVIGNHGDYDYWVVKLKSTVGIPVVNSGTEISVIPNPATDMISVTGVEKATIRIFDAIGRQIKEAAANTIRIKDLPSGIYLARIFDEQGALITQEKVIKQ